MGGGGTSGAAVREAVVGQHHVGAGERAGYDRGAAVCRGAYSEPADRLGHGGGGLAALAAVRAAGRGARGPGGPAAADGRDRLDPGRGDGRARSRAAGRVVEHRLAGRGAVRHQHRRGGVPVGQPGHGLRGGAEGAAGAGERVADRRDHADAADDRRAARGVLVHGGGVGAVLRQRGHVRGQRGPRRPGGGGVPGGRAAGGRRRPAVGADQGRACRGLPLADPPAGAAHDDVPHRAAEPHAHRGDRGARAAGQGAAAPRLGRLRHAVRLRGGRRAARGRLRRLADQEGHCDLDDPDRPAGRGRAAPDAGRLAQRVRGRLHAVRVRRARRAVDDRGHLAAAAAHAAGDAGPGREHEPVHRGRGQLHRRRARRRVRVQLRHHRAVLGRVRGRDHRVGRHLAGVQPGRRRRGLRRAGAGRIGAAGALRAGRRWRAGAAGWQDRPARTPTPHGRSGGVPARHVARLRGHGGRAGRSADRAAVRGRVDQERGAGAVAQPRLPGGADADAFHDLGARRDRACGTAARGGPRRGTAGRGRDRRGGPVRT